MSCAEDSDAVGRDATVVDVSLGRFVIEPAALSALAGDLQLRVTNTDPDLEHDLVVHGKGTRRLAPGESQTLEIPDVAAGEYPMWCDVPGHAAAGQTGTLIVNAATTQPGHPDPISD
jgi:nitrite reductase (NO-forming)